MGNTSMKKYATVSQSRHNKYLSTTSICNLYLSGHDSAKHAIFNTQRMDDDFIKLI